ncbi:MAG: energy transducer TonB [Betaproteobacteria bacterium HGW-Betaproteobacteria-10]|nr:MAG: energy transducer TonB [Betaproteobacteria bacterium HGW-Betaproteobacteria-10]
MGFKRRLAVFSTVTPLAWGIGISVFLHAIVLTMHFSFPDASNALREKALDIILVNAKSANKPRDAQALAQSNLDGGGNTDEKRRAKTPLPATQQQITGTDIQQMQRRVQELEAMQQKMLTQAKSLRTVTASQTASEQPTPTPTLSGLDLAESARAMARLEGEISKSTDEYNKRPRKKFIGARAEEYRFAQYIEDWRQKIERIGTLNYPAAARGKLYGSLLLTVTINADGEVTRIDINRSSGHKVLDDSARRIVQMASPYSPFPPSIRRDTDVIEITRTWYFTQGDQLSAK